MPKGSYIVQDSRGNSGLVTWPRRLLVARMLRSSACLLVLLWQAACLALLRPAPIARAAPLAASLAVPSAAASSFLFTTCQAGAEKLLKAEVGRTHPDLRFAFSRPGLVTFKNASAAGVVSPSVSLRSSFARVHGASVGQAATAAEVCELAQWLAPSAPLCLHVWCRDLGGMRFSHPLAVAERVARVAALRDELQSTAPAGLWAGSEVRREGLERPAFRPAALQPSGLEAGESPPPRTPIRKAGRSNEDPSCDRWPSCESY